MPGDPLAQSEPVAASEQFPLSWRVENTLVSYSFYLAKFICPTGLAVLYPRPVSHWPYSEIIAAAVVLVALTAAALFWRRRFPYIFVGWLWYLVMLLPVAGLVHFSIQAVADRFTYLPQIGICIALVWGLVAAWDTLSPRRWVRGAASTFVLVLLAMWAVSAWRQTSYWHDSRTLWTHTVACTSRNSIAHYKLGFVLSQQGHLSDAVAHYRKTVEIDPSDLNALNNLGNALTALNLLDEAVARFRKALELDPNDAPAHLNLGNALAAGGVLGEAIKQYQRCAGNRPQQCGAPQ